MPRGKGHVSATVLLSALLCASGARAEVVAVKAGRIITMAGAPLDVGSVVIEDGRIARVGKEVKLPQDAAVIDVSDSVVMPGLVDANARFGIRGDACEQSDEITPAFQMWDAVDRNSVALKHAAHLGVTTLRVAPGNENVFAGSGVVIKSQAGRLSEMLVREGGEVKVVMGNEAASGNQVPRSRRPDSFYFRQPTTRMGVVWWIRKSLFDVQTAVQSKETLDRGQQVIADALRGERPVYIAVRGAIDIETTFTIADEFGLHNLVLTECAEGYKMAEEIARRRVPVILGPVYMYPRDWLESYEAWDVNWNNAGHLTRAGVKVALASNDPGGPADLLGWATMAARNGLSTDDALRAVTVNPAEILGIADRVGALAKGRDADLLVLSGEPLQTTTRIEKVILRGRVVFDQNSGANANDQA